MWPKMSIEIKCIHLKLQDPIENNKKVKSNRKLRKKRKEDIIMLKVVFWDI